MHAILLRDNWAFLIQRLRCECVQWIFALSWNNKLCNVRAFVFFAYLCASFFSVVHSLRLAKWNWIFWTEHVMWGITWSQRTHSHPNSAMNGDNDGEDETESNEWQLDKSCGEKTINRLQLTFKVEFKQQNHIPVPWLLCMCLLACMLFQFIWNRLLFISICLDGILLVQF